MRILFLNIINFKGIPGMSISADGRNINIFGDNATGKTTIADAFNWLLNGKDSLNRSDFGIKPIDPETQEPIHGIETSVEVALSLGDAKTIILKKVYYEKWVKERGSATATFSGNTTDYYVNRVPVKKGEYEAEIKKIADEKAFKLLTNPLYFNEQIHWTERRKMLLQVCGDISDVDVIAGNSKLSALTAILGNNTIEQHKKIIAAAKAKINEDLEKIPARISELQKIISDTAGIVIETIKGEIESLRKHQDNLRQESIRIMTGGEIAEKNKRLAEINTELLNLRTEHEQKKTNALGNLRKQESEATSTYINDNTTVDQVKLGIEAAERNIKAIEAEIEVLYKKYDNIEAETFTFEQSDICPTCGQPLPADRLDEARQKAEADFNLDKSNRLETITGIGKDTRQRLDEFKAKLSELNNSRADAAKKADISKTNLDAIKLMIQNTQNGFQDVSETPEYKSKTSDANLLRAEITALQNGNQGRVAEIQTSITDIDRQIAELQAKISTKEQSEKATTRINELKDEEKRLGKEFEKLEGELFLTEEFTRTKVRMLDSKINDRFKFVRFKLFNVQINGGLEDACEALINTNGCWTPYSDANAAGRINGGIDIINALSEFYSFEAPMFIDNAESVVDLADTKAQVFRLVVSGPDKVLRVEVAA